MLDVEKLALEAGGVNMLCDGFDDAATVFEPAQLHRFAALVLEAAAVQCEDESWEGRRHADAIRAMKQGESNE